jgi:hypothetical protein
MHIAVDAGPALGAIDRSGRSGATPKTRAKETIFSQSGSLIV